MMVRDLLIIAALAIAFVAFIALAVVGFVSIINDIANLIGD